MKRILVIDDDPQLRQTVSYVLQRAGHEVITAASGDEGLRLAREHLPDLILSDVMMPGLDGASVLQAIRADPATANLQVVLMTGNYERLPARAGMNLGADDFLEKPFTIEVLRRCVEARLQRGDLTKRIETRSIEELRQTLNSTLPHEFFTPVAGILGLVDILRQELDQMPREEAHAMLKEIDRCTRRLHRTLKNYLSILELQSEDRAGQPPPVMPGVAVAETAKAAAQEAALRREREADLHLDLPPIELQVAPEELTTMVVELADNACGFSRRGTPVTVRLWQEAARAGFAVNDHGRGLTAEQIKKIGLFRQFDRHKYEQQGLGLGLILVMKLVEQRGGRLEITSEPGTGTTCTVSLPRV